MLCENIEAIRKSKGLSQEELAIKLNVVRQTISKWEQGEYQTYRDCPHASLTDTPGFLKNLRPVGRQSDSNPHGDKSTGHHQPTSGGLQRSVPTLFPALHLLPASTPAPSVAGHLRPDCVNTTL